VSAAPLPGPAAPAASGRHQPEAPLRLVPPVARAARAPFVLLVAGLLAAGLLALLLLNTVLAQDAFRLHDLARRGLVVSDRQQQLEQLLAAQRSPALLASRATALGMVPGSARSFARLADGRVVVVLSPAKPVRRPAAATPAPAVKPVPTPPKAVPATARKPVAPVRPTPKPSGSPR